MMQSPVEKYRPFPAVKLTNRRWPSQVMTQAPRWMSTDLRDGNQSLVEPMTIDMKLEFFDMLVAIGFKEIEVGFPSASQTEFDFVRRLIEEKRIPDDVTIEVLTQSRDELIRRTFESLEGAPRAIVHLYNALAPAFRRIVFGQSQEEIKALAVNGTRLIRQMALERPATHWIYQYSPETFSMTELPYVREVCDAVAQAWQPTPAHKMIVNLPATVEAAMPNVFADQVEWMHRNMSYRDSIILSVHPHNDRGTAVAAAELAVLAGAERVEGCLFGSGERTGNVDLVTLAMNLYTQGVDPHLDFSDIDAVRRVVERCNQIPVHPRHPYAGDLVFTAFSGSHQDAIRKGFAERREGREDAVWDVPYLPIDPADLGRSYDAVIRVNSQSGKGGATYLLERGLGFTPPRRLQIEFSHVVQSLADTSSSEVTGEAICALFKQVYCDVPGPLARADANTLRWRERGITLADPKARSSAATADGIPGEPAAQALAQRIGSVAGIGVQIVAVDRHPLAGGETAFCTAVRVAGGEPRYGVAMHAQPILALADSVVRAINRALADTVPAQAAA
jgi:2-isopropylmalate synthase